MRSTSLYGREEKRREEKRGACFDLMKCICIILVIVDHCGGLRGAATYIGHGKIYAMLEHLYIPLFFFVAGYFFKTYTSFKSFLLKKVNNLIVPLVFFAILFVLYGLGCGDIKFSLFSFVKHLIGNILIWPTLLWFLKTLFFSLCVFYMLNKLINKEIVLGAVCIIIGVIAYFFKQIYPLENLIISDLFNNIISALIVQSLLYSGLMLRCLVENKRVNTITLLIIIVIFSIVWYLSSFGGVFLIFAKIENNLILFYLASFSSIFVVWALCRLLSDYVIKYMKGLVWIGRYSMIVYGVHVFFVFVCSKYMNPYYTLLIVLALMPVMIWFFKRYFPAFVAQRDILVYNNGKIKVDWNVFSLKNR